MVDNTNRPTLHIGSDVEMARATTTVLSTDFDDNIVFSEGDFWFYSGQVWKSIDTHLIRRMTHGFDGAKYGKDGTIKLSKGRIDSIICEMGTALMKKTFFAEAAPGINCATG